MQGVPAFRHAEPACANTLNDGTHRTLLLGFDAVIDREEGQFQATIDAELVEYVG